MRISPEVQHGVYSHLLHWMTDDCKPQPTGTLSCFSNRQVCKCVSRAAPRVVGSRGTEVSVAMATSAGRFGFGQPPAALDLLLFLRSLFLQLFLSLLHVAQLPLDVGAVSVTRHTQRLKSGATQTSYFKAIVQLYSSEVARHVWFLKCV